MRWPLLSLESRVNNIKKSLELLQQHKLSFAFIIRNPSRFTHNEFIPQMIFFIKMYF